MKKKKTDYIKEIHPYKLTKPSKVGGRWQTVYRDNLTGKLKNVKAPSEEKLLEKLVPVYFSETRLENITFHELYQEWWSYKQTITNSPNTMKRHEQHYHKYFEKSKLHSEPINRIDELFLEMECNRIVKDFNLARKEWGNIKTILNGMFEYAVRKKYVQENPVTKIKILVRFRQVIRKTGKTETYNTEELRDLNEYLDRMYAEKGDPSFMAVKLNFLIGLRVGELASLKWSDWCDDNHLHIVREEIRDQTINAYEVVEHTKRTMTDSLCWFLKQSKF